MDDEAYGVHDHEEFVDPFIIVGLSLARFESKSIFAEVGISHLEEESTDEKA